MPPLSHVTRARPSRWRSSAQRRSREDGTSVRCRRAFVAENSSTHLVYRRRAVWQQQPSSRPLTASASDQTSDDYRPPGGSNVVTSLVDRLTGVMW